jgi:hypothetical protein
VALPASAETKVGSALDSGLSNFCATTSPNDCKVGGTMNTAVGGHRQQPLRCRRWQRDAQRQQGVAQPAVQLRKGIGGIIARRFLKSFTVAGQSVELALLDDDAAAEISHGRLLNAGRCR